MIANQISVKFGSEGPSPDLLIRLQAALNDIIHEAWHVPSVRVSGKYVYVHLESHVTELGSVDEAYLQGLASGWLAANGVEII